MVSCEKITSNLLHLQQSSFRFASNSDLNDQNVYATEANLFDRLRADPGIGDQAVRT
jgi:hypothetical protein